MAFIKGCGKISRVSAFSFVVFFALPFVISFSLFLFLASPSSVHSPRTKISPSLIDTKSSSKESRKLPVWEIVYVLI